MPLNKTRLLVMSVAAAVTHAYTGSRNLGANSLRMVSSLPRLRDRLSSVQPATGWSERASSSADLRSIPSKHPRHSSGGPARSREVAEVLRPLVVCGPSGVGKGTIINRFMDAVGGRRDGPRFGFSVSHTTRKPRPGEVDGTHYNFVTREQMEEKIRAGEFLEHAEVHGNLYGTSVRSLLDVSRASDAARSRLGGTPASGGRQCLLDIDVEGVRSVKEYQRRRREARAAAPRLGKERSTSQYSGRPGRGTLLPDLDARFVFIAPPSIDSLRERLVERGTETDETLSTRLGNAQAELDYGLAEGNFDAVVVNDDLDRAVEEFERVVWGLYRKRT